MPSDSAAARAWRKRPSTSRARARHLPAVASVPSEADESPTSPTRSRSSRASSSIFCRRTEALKKRRSRSPGDSVSFPLRRIRRADRTSQASSRAPCAGTPVAGSDRTRSTLAKSRRAVSGAARIRLGAPGDPRARVPADRQGRGAFRQGLPFPAAATGGRIRAHVELLRGRGIEVREKLVEGFLQPCRVARAHPAPAARLLELVLVLAEALEILAELGAHEARVLLEVLFLLEDLARRRQNALLLLLVEELELLLHRHVRRQDRLHDRSEERRLG